MLINWSRVSRAIILLIVGSGVLHGCEPKQDPGLIEVRVVVVAMFERGDVDDGNPGELELWVQRLGLDTEFEFPLGQDVLRMNDDGVMAIVTGGGIPNATASIMALGIDERFDLTNAYWLIAGISGADPEDLSLGSAAWAQHVVDGDLMYEIDGREIPETWPYGLVPLGVEAPTTDPEDLENSWAYDTIAYSLDAGLVEWAYSLTKDVDLGDAPGITAFRENYATYPEAQRAPFVTVGDTLSSSTYWHGAMMNHWANDWLKLYRGESANFMTSNMEDSGTLTALYRLDQDGRVDKDRVLVLRTVSNFTMPPAGQTADWSKKQPYPDNGLPSFESAFTVGNVVVQALLEGWDEYRTTTPGAD